MKAMTVIVFAPGTGPGSVALTSALEAGIGPVEVVEERVAALASLAGSPRAALVLDLRVASEEQLAEAIRLRQQSVGIHALALLAEGGAAPPHCDALFTHPVFLDDVVRWCARSTVAPVAEGLLEDLAAGLCHEIGNPLTSLFLQLELLRSDKDIASVQAHLSQIEEAARRIQGVVRDVAMAAERHPVRCEPTRLSALVQRVRTILVARDHTFADRLVVDVEDMEVAMDTELLARSLADLAEYLLHAGESDQPLELQAGPREDHGPSVRLAAAVPRLPPDAAARLFTPLWARQALGLPEGLSLTSARNAFLRHRGDVRARTLADGRLQLEAWLPEGDQATFSFPP
jgi:signal transduction histidine kinase